MNKELHYRSVGTALLGAERYVRIEKRVSELVPETLSFLLLGDVADPEIVVRVAEQKYRCASVCAVGRSEVERVLRRELD